MIMTDVVDGDEDERIDENNRNQNVRNRTKKWKRGKWWWWRKKFLKWTGNAQGLTDSGWLYGHSCRSAWIWVTHFIHLQINGGGRCSSRFCCWTIIDNRIDWKRMQRRNPLLTIRCVATDKRIWVGCFEKVITATGQSVAHVWHGGGQMRRCVGM